MHTKQVSHAIIALMLLYIASSARDSTNTITRNNFNFGHQLGYMYSRMDDAYFKEAGSWSFETGFLAYYTSEMPLVRNEYWKERLMLTIPLYFEFYPTDFIMLLFEITDVFVEFPYTDKHNIGGKSPRFKTKIRIIPEKKFIPAIAFTIGVKFSSAKPYTIWQNDHNYDESNGLAGAGTGVADYLLLFTFSKKLGSSQHISARIGLAPLGSPVEYARGSAQADEIPYGISIKRDFAMGWSGRLEVSGMYNGLKATRLAHYSVARLQITRSWLKHDFTVNLEHGLTKESDEWVAGFYQKFDLRKKQQK